MCEQVFYNVYGLVMDTPTFRQLCVSKYFIMYMVWLWTHQQNFIDEQLFS